MSDARDILSKIDYSINPNASYSALTPNLQGLETALDAEVKEVAVFVAASNTFNLKNINSSTSDALGKVREVMQHVKDTGAQVRVRGYVSTVLGCPYEGEIKPKDVADVASQLYEM